MAYRRRGYPVRRGRYCLRYRPFRRRGMVRRRRPMRFRRIGYRM